MITFLKDEDFIRDKVPMTKEEIRILSIAKLCLSENSVLYDIGAGTGSVSVEAARRMPQGRVFAVEKKHEAIELIKQNVSKFNISNICIEEANAPEDIVIDSGVTHVFIGGSSGKLLDIIDKFRNVNPKVRFVVNAISLETVAKLNEVMKSMPEYADMEVTQVNISKSKKMGDYNLMSAQNPVYIASFGGK